MTAADLPRIDHLMDVTELNGLWGQANEALADHDPESDEYRHIEEYMETVSILARAAADRDD